MYHRQQNTYSRFTYLEAPLERKASCQVLALLHCTCTCIALALHLHCTCIALVLALYLHCTCTCIAFLHSCIAYCQVLASYASSFLASICGIDLRHRFAASSHKSARAERACNFYKALYNLDGKILLRLCSHMSGYCSKLWLNNYIFCRLHDALSRLDT